MRIPGVKTARMISRWLQARLYGGALILGYHQVASFSRNSYEVCVSPEHFAEHLELLRKYSHPISLSKLVNLLEKGTLPARSVAVTFDDGYADNLYNARPLLEKYEIPATIFVCTGYLGREFWWDELERLVMTSNADLRILYSELRQKQYEWKFTAAGHGAENSKEGSVRGKLLKPLYYWLLTLAPRARDKVMDMIRLWAESQSETLPISRALTSEELLALADLGLIDIGAHTRTHPILTRLTGEEQAEEIASSKQYLEDLLNRQVWGFAYPNGKMTTETREILHRTGFKFACCSEIDLIRPGHDHYNLPRFWPGDENGDKFMRKLKLWI